jgi:hypothetical protein
VKDRVKIARTERQIKMAEEKQCWQPPQFISREQCIKDTEEILGKPDLQLKQTEDVFRVNVLGMEWDLGMMVYEPDHAGRIPTGADGKKAGFFLLHGGSGDFRGIERIPSSSPISLDSKLSPGLFPGDSIFPTPTEIGPMIRSTAMAPYARRYGNGAK